MSLFNGLRANFAENFYSRALCAATGPGSNAHTLPWVGKYTLDLIFQAYPFQAETL